MGSLWVPYGFPMGSLWVPYGFPMGRMATDGNGQFGKRQTMIKPAWILDDFGVADLKKPTQIAYGIGWSNIMKKKLPVEVYPLVI